MTSESDRGRDEIRETNERKQGDEVDSCAEQQGAEWRQRETGLLDRFSFDKDSSQPQ
jgi:hypothetical protein